MQAAVVFSPSAEDACWNARDTKRILILFLVLPCVGHSCRPADSHARLSKTIGEKKKNPIQKNKNNNKKRKNNRNIGDKRLMTFITSLRPRIMYAHSIPTYIRQVDKNNIITRCDDVANNADSTMGAKSGAHTSDRFAIIIIIRARTYNIIFYSIILLLLLLCTFFSSSVF